MKRLPMRKIREALRLRSDGFSGRQAAQSLGIVDWITAVLEKNGTKVRSVIPKEGGLHFTETGRVLSRI